MRPRLGVNIDHVATLRQARGEFYPSIQKAAELAIDSGADQITIHLREDRRHIQDADVGIVKEVVEKKANLLNLEIGTDWEITKIAATHFPDWVCIVPEKREERTTEGGLGIHRSDICEKVEKMIAYLAEQSPETRISLFVEASDEMMKAIENMEGKVHAVEIHTGDYAKDYLEGKNLAPHLAIYQKTKEWCQKMKIGHHAGHGLTDESVAPLVEANLFEEYNIGHWIISESVFSGMGLWFNV